MLPSCGRATYNNVESGQPENIQHRRYQLRSSEAQKLRRRDVILIPRTVFRPISYGIDTVQTADPTTRLSMRLAILALSI